MAIVGMKDIKRRKKSIESTMKVTKAMELVAFFKLKKSKQRADQTKPFFNRIYDVMMEVSKDSKNIDSVFVNKRPVIKRCYIVIAGDKGLAGGYNSDLFKLLEYELINYNKQDYMILAIGKKVLDFCKKQDYMIYNKYVNISEKLDINVAIEISNRLVDGFVNNEFQELNIVFTEFESMLTQRPNLKKILPIYFDNNNIDVKNKNIIYDPSPQAVFNMIVPQYIAGILYGAVAESFASEQGARRVAMEAANKSANDMLKDLNIMFNKVRQSNITQEINEISAGAKTI